MSRFFSRGKSFSLYKRESKRKKAGKVLFFLLLFFLLVNFISLFLIRSYRTETASMDPALPEGARFFATGIPYGIRLSPSNVRLPGFREPRRGDIVVLSPPYIEDDPWYLDLLDGTVRFFTLQRVGIKPSAKKDWENEELVKRIVGIPGDTLRIEDYRVFVKPGPDGPSPGEGRFVPETEFYPDSGILFPDFPANWNSTHPFSGTMAELTLGESEYFVLSDNRGRGSDSLVWGVLDRDRIDQKVVFRYWPKPGFRF